MSDRGLVSRTPRAGSSLAALFAAVFLFMFADTVLLTILPVTLKQTGAASAGLIGLLVALPQGIGFITALPAAAYGDTRGPARLASWAACLAALASVAAIAAAGRPVAWWLLPVIGIGLARLVVWTSLLAAVSTSGDPPVMQGLNGATQRAAAAVAAVATAVVIGRQAWSSGYVGVAVPYAVLVPLTLIALARAGRNRTGEDRPDEGRERFPRPAQSYRFTAQVVVSDPAIRASSLVAMCAVTVMTLGSSFFALTLDASPRQVAGTLVILLLTRDVTSIATGPLLPRVLRRLGVGGTVVLATVSGAAGLAALAAPARGWPLTVAAAALQGVSICLCIGCTNLLAVGSRGRRVAGPGLRIASSNLGACAGSLLLPVGMGAVLEHGGATALFAGTAAVTAVLGAGARWSIGFLPPPPAAAGQAAAAEASSSSA
jgi:predicted MFS family arabinose efflux permease